MRNNQNGQSLIEVIVASVVGILVVTALVLATIFSLRNASFAKNSAQATKLAQEGMEKVRTLRDRDGQVDYTILPGPPATYATKFNDLWPPVSLICPTNCYFYFNASGVLSGGTDTTLESIPPNFQRQIVIEDAGSNQKTVTVIVRWTDFAGKHESKLTTILRKL